MTNRWLYVLAHACALTLASPALAQSKPTAEALTVYQRHLDIANKLFAAQAYDAAVTEYEAAYASAAKPDVLRKVLESHKRGGSKVKARDTAQRLLDKHAKELKSAEKKELKTLLESLGASIGRLEIKAAENGAEIVVDEKPAGRSPLATPLELDAGSHKVSARKDGFEASEQSIVVEGGKAVTLEIVLEAEITTGKLAVSEAAASPLDVYVDGKKVGSAPWEGDLALGSHEVKGLSAAAAAPAQKVEIAKRARAEIVLVSAALTGTVEVVLGGAPGTIRIDGKTVGTARASVVLPVGPHTVEAARPGAVAQTKQIVVTTKGERLEFELAPEKSTTRPHKGVYGGLTLAGLFQLTRQGNEADVDCTLSDRCSSQTAKGGAIGGYAGYTWNPVGVEAFVAASGDVSRATFQGVGFDDIVRTGGLAALRVRGTLQTKIVRVSLAAGPGVAHRVLIVSGDAAQYTSPAFAGDLAFSLRASPTLAIALGANVWVEHAGSDATASLRDTARYTLASGPQVMVLPYVGFQFGP